MIPHQLEERVEFAGFECIVYETAYEYGGATAIYLVDATDRTHVATATINVEGVSEKLPASEVLIKNYLGHEGMMDALIKAGLIEDTGLRVPTGYVTVPVARLLYNNGREAGLESKCQEEEV